MQSPPSRGCGLKCGALHGILGSVDVTPFAGVWIEINSLLILDISVDVTPFAGVWIEIKYLVSIESGILSRPSRGCGLKLDSDLPMDVAAGHPLRGGVD